MADQTADQMADQIGRCPCCGAISGTTLAQPPALLAVCDVLVVRALEAVGKMIVRSTDRSRRAAWQGKPWHEAHTVWRPDDAQTDKCLHGAWDVVPAMLNAHGCCGITAGQVTGMLDRYVRDLLITGTPHQLGELRYRFEAFLGVELPPEHSQTGLPGRSARTEDPADLEGLRAHR